MLFRRGTPSLFLIGACVLNAPSMGCSASAPKGVVAPPAGPLGAAIGTTGVPNDLIIRIRIEGGPTCPRVIVGLDDATPSGLTPRDAVRALRADEQHFVLVEDHLGFFDEVEAGAPVGKDEVTVRFRPAPGPATYFAACGEDLGYPYPIVYVSGTVTAVLSRGPTFTASGEMRVEINGTKAIGGTFSEFSHKAQIVWELGDGRPAGNGPDLILHRDRSDSFWR